VKSKGEEGEDKREDKSKPQVRTVKLLDCGILVCGVLGAGGLCLTPCIYIKTNI